MTLDQVGNVDIVVKTPGGGGELLIIDAGVSGDEEQRYYLLTQKLITYANYVASGQYEAELSGVPVSNLTIRVVGRTPPNQSMQIVNSIATRDEPVIRIPVVLESEADFFARTRGRKAGTPGRPWWKLW